MFAHLILTCILFQETADKLYTRLTNLADVTLKGQDKISFAVLKSLLEAFRMGYEFR
jgi:hypothetical protein